MSECNEPHLQFWTSSTSQPRQNDLAIKQVKRIMRCYAVSLELTSNWVFFFSLGSSRLTEITQSTLKQIHKALHCSFFSTWFSISCCMHNYPCTPGAMRDETRVNHCFYFSRLLFIEDKNRSLYLEIQSATYTFWLLISIRYACNRNGAMAQKETWRQ